MSLLAMATLAALVAEPADAPALSVSPKLAQAMPVTGSQNTVLPSGDYMTTPQGCTYRRTKAPGYPERWILVLNPHHLGLPNSPRRCQGMM